MILMHGPAWWLTPFLPHPPARDLVIFSSHCLLSLLSLSKPTKPTNCLALLSHINSYPSTCLVW